MWYKTIYFTPYMHGLLLLYCYCSSLTIISLLLTFSFIIVVPYNKLLCTESKYVACCTITHNHIRMRKKTVCMIKLRPFYEQSLP